MPSDHSTPPEPPGGPAKPKTALPADGWPRQAIVGRFTVAMLAAGSIRGLTARRPRSAFLGPKIFN